MEIKKAFQKLTEPQAYLPTVAGGVAGVFGGVYILDMLKSYTVDDMQDWAAKAGFTACALVGMMTYKPKGERDNLGIAVNTALTTAAVTGGIVLASKALNWGPVTIGRVGAAGVARTGVKVVGKPTTPTFAQAPVQTVQPPAAIAPAFAEVGSY
jgi:hypothetical protein